MISKKFFSIKDLAPVIEEMVNAGTNVKFTITGNSMLPLFAHRRDQVTVAKSDNISKYDIVLHKRADGTYILHRVISVKNGILTIAGDNETAREHNVSRSQVIAKVISFERKGKEISVNNLLYKIYSRIWLMIFPFRHFVLGILIPVRRLLGEKKQ